MKQDRILTDIDEKSRYNAWDHAELSGSALISAEQKVKLDEFTCNNKNNSDLNLHAEEWESFYKQHQNNFFKDRKWMLRSFMCLSKCDSIFELGCGVGNSLSYFSDKEIAGCDFSHSAIELCKSKYKGTFFVHDITQPILDIKTQYDSVLLIYTLSAIHPKNHNKVFTSAVDLLKPGGIICFKDYGYLDMVQLRYKSTSAVEKNFYRRSDGTYTYFFSLEEIEQYAKGLSLEVVELQYEKKLLINRKKNLDMYRVYIHAILKLV